MKFLTRSTLHRTAPVASDRLQFRSTPIDSGLLRMTQTPVDFERLRTTPGDSEQLRTTPNDFGRLRTTPGDSGRLRMTPEDSERLRTTPKDSGRLQLRTTPTPDDSNSGRLQLLPELESEWWVRSKEHITNMDSSRASAHSRYGPPNSGIASKIC